MCALILLETLTAVTRLHTEQLLGITTKKSQLNEIIRTCNLNGQVSNQNWGVSTIALGTAQYSSTLLCKSMHTFKIFRNYLVPSIFDITNHNNHPTSFNLAADMLSLQPLVH
jgi:hypothetical protein